MPDEGSNLVLLPSAVPPDELESPIERQGRGYECRHKRTKLDEESHRVFCRDCEAELDPWQVLAGFAADWDSLTLRYRGARNRAEREEERLLDLLRQEKNAKARRRKRGVVLSTTDARASLDQLRALARAVANVVGDVEEAKRTAKLCGFRPDDLARAVRALDEALR